MKTFSATLVGQEDETRSSLTQKITGQEYCYFVTIPFLLLQRQQRVQHERLKGEFRESISRYYSVQNVSIQSEVGKVCILAANSPIRLELISSFSTMKRLGVFLLSPGWADSPSQGFPSMKFAGTHLYTWVERGTVRVKCLAKHTRQCPRSGLESGPFNLELSALTMRPQHFPSNLRYNALFSFYCSHILCLGQFS